MLVQSGAVASVLDSWLKWRSEIVHRVPRCSRSSDRIDEAVGSAAGSCGVLEIRWGRGRRVFSGLAVVGKSEGLNAPIGARVYFSPWIYALLLSPLTSPNFLSRI